MNKDLIILPDQFRQRSAVFVLIISGMLALLFRWNGVSGWNAVAASAFIFLVSVFGLLSFETRISQTRQRVIRVWRLGGFLPVWRRSYPFSDLLGIQQRLLTDAQHDIWQIGLVTAAERFLMVTYFTTRTLDDPCPDAERFRDYLSRILGVPVLGQEQAA